jgi:tRNA nucleotidyltransferase (CCA-adding enzyme)
MAGKEEKILKEQLSIITPSATELKILDEIVRDILSRLNSQLKDAKAMIGGSFAKNTIIKKNVYDLDIFVKFNYEKYKMKNLQISDILLGALKKLNGNKLFTIEVLHGSRDYFRIHLKKKTGISIPVYIEIVPVLDIKKAQDALNITDISPLHVLYVLEKIRKKPELADSIRLAKSFCYGQSCYGAESYIHGFSGYCLEILCIHFGSFQNLLKAANKWNAKNKIIIDPAYFYRNKDIMIEMNEAKIISPMILIDPVQSDRNAAAALNEEKLRIFMKAAQEFLKNPSLKFFIKKEISKEEMQKFAKAKKMPLFVIRARSSKEKEDVAGAKLFKIFNILLERFNNEGKAEGKWRYNMEKREAEFFFLFKPEKKIEIKGPPVKLKENAEAFKKKWLNAFIKSGNLYAHRKNKSIKEIISLPKNQLNEMGIKEIRLE